VIKVLTPHCLVAYSDRFSAAPEGFNYGEVRRIYGWLLGGEG